MFSGIIEEIGRVSRLDRDAEAVRLSVDASQILDGLKVGDSISVDGACLTVTEFDGCGFSVGLAPETLRRTTLGALEPGNPVNLERAVRPGDRLSGHYVQGHVDGTAVIVDRQFEGDSLLIWFEPSSSLLPYVVEKGYVAVDGISLTVASREATRFSVALVAYTREHVALAQKNVGGVVNLEVDVIAKYVESILEGRRTGAV
ncbi:MAG: riboflavin synthase [Chloroflexi bacterium]|nr:riboflavin synthase [Chloroflexota bacterium]